MGGRPRPECSRARTRTAAAPARCRSTTGSGASTWREYASDSDGEGRHDIYDIADAACTAARYLRASGAPDDWRGAIFAYNHDEAYVARVLELAASYRRELETSDALADVVTAATGSWLSPMPGDPGARCDSRIVADVVANDR